MSTKSIDETTELRDFKQKVYNGGFVVFFCMQHATTCHQQSVRSNESLLQPATRRSGITSLRRSGRTSRCGRNNPRYVCNALSHAGSVSVYLFFLLRNLKQSQNLLCRNMLLCAFARYLQNTLVLQIVLQLYKVPQVSDN